MGRLKKETAATALSIWLGLIILFMILSGFISLEIFFVLWLIGLLVIIELITLPYLTPPYMAVLRLTAGAGVVLFAALVAGKVLEIIAS